MAIAPNDAIVVAGEYRRAGGGQTYDFAVVRVNPGGGVQTQTTDIDDGDDYAYGVAFNRFNSKIVLSGYSKPHPGVTHNEFATVRYTPRSPPTPSSTSTARRGWTSAPARSPGTSPSTPTSGSSRWGP